MKAQNKTLAAVAPLFLILFIDSMGLGLLIPILNGLIVDPTSGFLIQHFSLSARDFLYGFTLGIFMLCWFFGSAILGDLSDVVGRKRSLLVCLFGSFVGYFLSAIAVIFHSLLLLLVGRMVAGFTAGSQPIAQAAIVDVSPDALKARNLGLILLSISLGFIFGPILGGLLSDSRLVSWFDFATPLYFASVVSLLNAFLLLWLFQETFEKSGKMRIQITRAVHIFISAFRYRGIKNLSIVMIVMIFGWSSYFTFISLFLLNIYHYSTLTVSLFLAVLGAGFGVGCGYVVNFCAKRFALKSTVICSLIISGFFASIPLLSLSEWVSWFSAFLIGISMSVAYSTILTIFSNQVGKNEQGWVMGVTGSIMALCFGLNSLLTGAIVIIGSIVPLIIASVFLIVSGLLLKVL